MRSSVVDEDADDDVPVNVIADEEEGAKASTVRDPDSTRPAAAVVTRASFMMTDKRLLTILDTARCG